MLDFFRGNLKGKKLAKESSKLCEDIVNILINNGFALELPDTTYILQESYAICTFMMLRPGMNRTRSGAMTLMARNLLKDWLLKVFSDAKSDYEFENTVQVIIDDLPKYFSEWTSILKEKHKDLIGKNKYQWLPAANGHFIDQVSSYIYSNFDKQPDNFLPTLNYFVSSSANKLLTSGEKLSLSSSLKEDLPKDFKKDIEE